MDDDHDQAAILARRRRLIALSLFGLTGPACASAPAPASTHAREASPFSEQSQPIHQPGVAEHGRCRSAPQPCLSIVRDLVDREKELEDARRQQLLELERQAIEASAADEVEAESESEPES